TACSDCAPAAAGALASSARAGPAARTSRSKKIRSSRTERSAPEHTSCHNSIKAQERVHVSPRLRVTPVAGKHLDRRREPAERPDVVPRSTLVHDADHAAFVVDE